MLCINDCQTVLTTKAVTNQSSMFRRGVTVQFCTLDSSGAWDVACVLAATDSTTARRVVVTTIFALLPNLVPGSGAQTLCPGCLHFITTDVWYKHNLLNRIFSSPFLCSSYHKHNVFPDHCVTCLLSPQSKAVM